MRSCPLGLVRFNCSLTVDSIAILAGPFQSTSNDLNHGIWLPLQPPLFIFSLSFFHHDSKVPFLVKNCQLRSHHCIWKVGFLFFLMQSLCTCLYSIVFVISRPVHPVCKALCGNCSVIFYSLTPIPLSNSLLAPYAPLHKQIKTNGPNRSLLMGISPHVENGPLIPIVYFLSFSQLPIYENTCPFIPWPLSVPVVRDFVNGFLKAYNVCWPIPVNTLVDIQKANAMVVPF